MRASASFSEKVMRAGLTIGACFRIVSPHFRTGRPKLFEQTSARCFAHVVRIRLERKPPQGDRLAAQGTAKMARQQVEQFFFLLEIDGLDSIEQARFIVVTT